MRILSSLSTNNSRNQVSLTLALSLALLMNCGGGGKDTTQDQQIEQEMDVMKDAAPEVVEVAEYDANDMQEEEFSELEEETVGCTDDNQCTGELPACKKWTCNKPLKKCEEVWEGCTCFISKLSSVYSFENGKIDPMTVSDSKPEDDVTWTVVEHSHAILSSDGKGGKKTLFLGIPQSHKDNSPSCFSSAGEYETSLLTPWMELPPVDVPLLLSFYTWMDLTAPENPVDLFQVLVQKEGDSSPDVLFNSTEINNVSKVSAQSKQPEFLYFLYELSQYKGKKIRIEFKFKGGSVGTCHGIYLDEIKLSVNCQEKCDAGADCADDNKDCTEDKCAGFGVSKTGKGYCTYPYNWECLYPECETSWTQDKIQKACEDNDKCTIEKCENNKCVNDPIIDCCKLVDLYSENFDKGGIGDFTLQSNNTKVKWQAVDSKSVSASYSLYFGDVQTKNYGTDCVANNTGTASTPEVDFPPAGNPFLSFQLYLSTEYDGEEAEYINPVEYDTFKVLVNYTLEDKPKKDTVWVSHWVKGTTKKAFMPVGVDLSKYKGKKAKIQFSFDTVDCNKNSFEGVYIDDVVINSHTCIYKNCMTEFDCGADGICKTATCDSNVCAITNTGGENCCSSVKDCNDNDDCTIDSCVEHSCLHTVKNTEECCKNEIFKEYKFESGNLEDFTVIDDGSTVKWKPLVSKCPSGGNNSLYFGNGISYNNGTIAEGIAKTAKITLPAIAPPAIAPVYMSFEAYLDIESNPAKDIFQVEITDVSSSKSSVIFDKTSPDVSYKQCFTAVLDISGYAGKEVTVSFKFNSVDSLNNSGQGIWIDNIKFYKGCL